MPEELANLLLIVGGVGGFLLILALLPRLLGDGARPDDSVPYREIRDRLAEEES